MPCIRWFGHTIKAQPVSIDPASIRYSGLRLSALQITQTTTIDELNRHQQATTMAYYSESGGYCAEDVMRRPYAEPGYRYGEGGERYAVRKEYEEVDEVARAGRGHYGHGGAHLGRSGSHHHHGVVGHGHLGGEQHRVHGHGHDGGRHYDACESRRYDSCTGEYYA